jgi:hypothetical protein
MMVTAHLILTVDYEVFGNGLGRIDPCVLAPAQRMMDIADPFGAPLPFFVEATEFMIMEEAGVAAVYQVRRQIARAISHGHDAQLHLHPQWEGAFRQSDGSWRMDNARWRIGDLPFEESLRILREGKTWLENVARKGFPQYQCLAFRAGGWCIQPSQEVVRALGELGFQIDSTVAPAMRNTLPGEWSDFRTAPLKPYWKTDRDVCADGASGLWEVPIATGKIGRWRHLQAVKAAWSAGEGGLAPGCRGDYHGPDSRLQGLRGRIGKVLRLGQVMLDVSTMPADVLIEITRQWIRRFGVDESPVPLVAIAHTKNFTPASEKNMSEYLAWAKNEGIIFSTYGRWLEAIDG